MVSQLLLGVIGFLPGVALVYVVLGRHEEHFRDEAMFLALMGGLVMGLAIAFVEAFMLRDWAAGASVGLFVVVTLPLVETMAKTVVLGLKRFRNNEETVLLGGAMGAGLSAMLFMFYGQFVRSEAVTVGLGVSLTATSIGFALVHFVTGMMVGTGPARGKVTGGFWPGYLYLVPAHLLFVASTIDLTGGVNQPFAGSLGFPLAIALYGVGLVLWKGRELVMRGLPPDERRRLRRERLKEARQTSE